MVTDKCATKEQSKIASLDIMAPNESIARMAPTSIWHLLCFGYSQNGFTVFLQCLLITYINNNVNTSIKRWCHSGNNIQNALYKNNSLDLDVLKTPV